MKTNETLWKSFHIFNLVHSINDLLADSHKRLLVPILKPIDDTSIENGRRVAGFGREVSARGIHLENHVKILLDFLDEVIVKLFIGLSALAFT
jgi:hypothetical protein